MAQIGGGEREKLEGYINKTGERVNSNDNNTKTICEEKKENKLGNPCTRLSHKLA